MIRHSLKIRVLFFWKLALSVFSRSFAECIYFNILCVETYEWTRHQNYSLYLSKPIFSVFLTSWCSGRDLRMEIFKKIFEVKILKRKIQLELDSINHTSVQTKLCIARWNVCEQNTQYMPKSRVLKRSKFVIFSLILFNYT